MIMSQVGVAMVRSAVAGGSQPIHVYVQTNAKTLYIIILV